MTTTKRPIDVWTPDAWDFLADAFGVRPGESLKQAAARAPLTTNRDRNRARRVIVGTPDGAATEVVHRRLEKACRLLGARVVAP